MKELAGIEDSVEIEEARQSGDEIVATILVRATKVDSGGVPMAYSAELYDIAKKVPMDPGMGVKRIVNDRSGHGAVMKMAKSWSNSGFLD